MNDAALAKLDIAKSALAECKTVMEAKQIADVAEVARIYLMRTKASSDAVHQAAEIRTLAERQMGAFLKQMPKATGAKGTGSNQYEVRSREGTTPVSTLASIGITKKQSATAQKLADIPEAEVKERIAVLKASGEAPLANRVLGIDKKPERKKKPLNQAMFLARGAVDILEQITPDDPLRHEGIHYVFDWCKKQLNP